MTRFGGSHDVEVELERGAIVVDRFHVVTVIGRGATSSVYRAHDALRGGDVALKVLRAALHPGTIAARRFEREAQLVARLDHPAIVRLFATGWLANRQPWLALELLHGETLEAILTREQQLPLSRVILLLGDVLDALGAAHSARVLHRDLKPANLFVVHDPDGTERARLLDFGVSRDLGDEGPRLTAPPQMVGTIGYLSPEQITPGVDPDERADLWAVGVVAYLALTGRAPFGLRSARVVASILETDPAPPSTLAPALDPRADAFVAKALAKDRERRYRSAAAMREALLDLS